MAKTHLGERRIPGPGTNPFIEGLFIEVGSPLRGDDHSYCAVGAGAMLKRTGFAYIAGEPGQLARSYLNYGHALDEPEEGCLVVFWRVKPNSWQGHVAFVESWTATTLTIVGFNQSGAVTRMTVPRTGARSQVLGYRRPVLAARPATEIVREDSVGQKVVGITGTLTALWYTAKDWIAYVVDSIATMIGFAPDIAAGVTSHVATGQQITKAAGLPWPAKLGLIIVLITLAFGLYRTWKRLRPNDGSLTKSPYETDIEPEADAVDMFDAMSGFSPSIEGETELARALIHGPIADRLAEIGDRRRAEAAAERRRPRAKKPAAKKAAAKRKRAA